MSLKTRLDSRSDNNKSLNICGSNGEVKATIKLVSGGSTTLEIETDPEFHIRKETGWSSKRH